MDKKGLATKKLFEKLNREMPKLARLAMLDIQSHLEESKKRQKSAKKIIQSKICH
jgi:predicted lipid carrier protein YhbT